MHYCELGVSRKSTRVYIDGEGARILVYRIPKKPAREPWPVEVADNTLHIVHNVIVVNFDADRQEQIVAASREGLQVLERGRDGTVYKRVADGAWRRARQVDDGGMATEDLAVADLDGDGRPEIVAAGRSTGNAKIHWNEAA